MRRVGTRPLWIGHAGDARDPAGLHAVGIEAVIDLAREESLGAVSRDLAYLRFPIVDGSENPSWVLRVAVETVAQLVRDRVPTLVSCGAGMSRSVAIAAGGLARAEGRAIEECLAEIVAHGCRDIAPMLWHDIVHLP